MNNFALKYIIKYKYSLLIVLVLMLTGTILHMLIPLIYSSIINELNNKDSYINLVKLATFYFLISSLLDVLYTGQIYFHNRTGSLIAFSIRQDLLKHIQNLPMGYFYNNKQGDLLTRLTSDVNLLESFITKNSVTIMASFIQVLITLSMLFYLNYKLAFISLLFIPITQLLLNMSNKKISKFTNIEKENLSKLNSILHEILNNMYILKLFNGTKKSIIKTINPTRNLIKSRLKSDLFSGIAGSSANISSSFSVVFLFYVIGGYEVFNNRMNIGDLLAFSMYLGWVVQPLIRVFKVTTIYSRVKISYNRINQIFMEEEEPYLDEGIKIDSFKDKITINKLLYSYHEANEILRGISLDIKKGESIAFVGNSGCGKTTLINLLLKVINCSRDMIKIDNIDINDINTKSIRDFFGVVTQDTFLFDGTIRENLKMFKNSTDNEIKNACTLAHIDDFISSLPEKYETVIGEKGVKLSGGQKQRLAIARAILYNPEVYIFDEATSSLDSESEKYVLDALDMIMKDKTSIIIAHRLSTLKNVDKIFVFEEGKIVEFGSHKNLLENKGAYYKLWELNKIIE